ncbi:metallophosphoesterase [Ectobacillus funiculus]|uniref:Metallophosphoesterase n=1 Tax=Ectobacillus funiculus TaxID=137993 RepID=A0ABV5WAZ4_9BACI
MIVILLLVIIACLTWIVFMYKEAHVNRVIYQEYCFPDFPRSFGEVRIFFISDIHKRQLPDTWIRDMQGKADFVVIGGDLTEKGVPLTRMSHNLRLLSQIGPVYFVWGNNDYETERHDLDALLLDHKVKSLDNTAVLFESEEGEKLWLLGVDDTSLGKDRLDWALADCGEEGFRILVSHNPDIVQKFTEKERISFVLSGHTHGGQIYLLPSDKYMRGGTYSYAHTLLLVSNGYGTTFVPLRFRAPVQTHLLSLKRKEV